MFLILNHFCFACHKDALAVFCPSTTYTATYLSSLVTLNKMCKSGSYAIKEHKGLLCGCFCFPCSGSDNAASEEQSLSSLFFNHKTEQDAPFQAPSWISPSQYCIDCFCGLPQLSSGMFDTSVIAQNLAVFSWEKN